MVLYFNYDISFWASEKMLILFDASLLFVSFLKKKKWVLGATIVFASFCAHVSIFFI